MKSFYKFIYFLSSFIIYVILGLIEFFFLDNFVDIVSERYVVHVLALCFSLLIINPIITYKLVNTLPFKPFKRIKGSVKDDLKKEIQHLE